MHNIKFLFFMHVATSESTLCKNEEKHGITKLIDWFVSKDFLKSLEINITFMKLQAVPHSYIKYHFARSTFHWCKGTQLCEIYTFAQVSYFLYIT